MNHLALIISADPRLIADGKDFVAELGFEVTTAQTKLEVPAILSKSTPSLILCDREMPGINTLLLCKALRESEVFKSIIFVLLTPRTLWSKTEPAAREATIDCLSPKPLNKKQLAEQIQELIKQREQTIANKLVFQVLVRDTLHRAIVLRMIEVLGGSGQNCPTVYDAIVNSERYSEAIFVTDRDNLAECLDLAPANVKRLIVLRKKEDPAIPQASKHQLTELLHPFSSKVLAEALRNQSETLTDPDHPINIEFSDSEQALIAARLSASVYERLLASSALKHGNWQEIARLARNEILAVSKSLNEILLMKRD